MPTEHRCSGFDGGGGSVKLWRELQSLSCPWVAPTLTGLPMLTNALSVPHLRYSSVLAEDQSTSYTIPDSYQTGLLLTSDSGVQLHDTIVIQCGTDLLSWSEITPLRR